MLLHLARVEVPELESELTRKEAEIHEVQALLRRMEASPRQEEVLQQQQRVLRAEKRRDLANVDLTRASSSYEQELAGLDLNISKAESDLEYRQATYRQSESLYKKGGLSGYELLAERRQFQIAEAGLSEAQTAKRARVAEGLMTYEAELARRQKELEEAQGSLDLLLAGTRSEDIEAQQARLERLLEEQKHLLSRRAKQLITAPADGGITTPRRREKLGQFLTKGAEFCIVEDQSKLEAEIAIAEQGARVLDSGQTVSLKPRSQPFQNLDATVERIGTHAGSQSTDKVTNGQADSGQPSVLVYCSIQHDNGELRSGMTGYGRIYHRWRPLGWIAMTKSVQFFRTEFWL